IFLIERIYFFISLSPYFSLFDSRVYIILSINWFLLLKYKALAVNSLFFSETSSFFNSSCFSANNLLFFSLSIIKFEIMIFCLCLINLVLKALYVEKEAIIPTMKTAINIYT